MSGERGIKSLDQASGVEHSGNELAGRASSVWECLRFPPAVEALTLGNNICLNKAVKCSNCKENTAKLRVQLW